VSDATIEAGPRLRGADLFAKATFAAGVFVVVFVVGFLATTHLPYDALGYLVGRDFLNTWMGARAALDGSIIPLFNFHTYQAIIHHTFGPLPPEYNWSYPPHILLFIWPLGYLPYLAGLAVWSVAGFAIYLVVASTEDRSRTALLFLAVSPAVGINLVTGQNGFFTAALLILAVRHVDRKPILVGLCLGILTLKPQLGLLFPLALALSGRWRCLASAALTALALAGATTVLFGPEVWTGYLREVVPFQTAVMYTVQGLPLGLMPTAFMNARLWGAGPDVAWLVQTPFTLLAAVAVVWAFAKRRDPQLSMAVLITAGFIATPYIAVHDMVVFGWLIAVLRPRLCGIWDARLALAVWTLPVTTILFGLCHLPVSAPILAAFLLRLVWLLRNDASQAVRYEPATA